MQFIRLTQLNTNSPVWVNKDIVRYVEPLKPKGSIVYLDEDSPVEAIEVKELHFTVAKRLNTEE